MVFSFDPDLGSDLDTIRHLLGDTDETSPLRPDEEYDALLLQESDWRLAAARMAESLANQFARSPDSVSISGEISVSWRERVRAWQMTASRLRSELAAERVSSLALLSVAAEREGTESEVEYYRAYW